MSDSKRPTFGNRVLTNPEDVFKHNAWDNVEWDSCQEDSAKEKLSLQKQSPMVPENAKDLLDSSAHQWDVFYGKHENRFFKDRHWLFTEFPELLKIVNESPSSSQRCNILEVGCGVGNTVFPVLECFPSNANAFMYCCDYSSEAIKLVKQHNSYNESRCHCFQWDITDSNAEIPVPDGSLDMILLIFVLSAIQPEKLVETIANVTKLLRPGGCIAFRDYGQYDMAQLRFKSGRLISDNFYARGDGTCVNFFTSPQLNDLFTGAGLIEEQNWVDRRLQVNRGKALKMYRIWIQCIYRKPKPCDKQE